MKDIIKKRSELNREDLKQNFLRTIIIRFDFSGLSESELEALIADIKPLLTGYNKLRPELATEMDFQLDDPETIEMMGIPVRDVRRQKVYVFENQTKGIQLKLSSVFAYIIIEKSKYIDFFDYSGTLLKVVKLIQEKIDFFSANRFGLRKINQCVFRDISLLNNYFEPMYYHLFSLDGDSTSKLFQAKDCIMHGQYNINLSRTIVRGELDGRDAYQVILDSDIYLSDTDKVEKLINNASLLKPMNDILFDIYKSVITEEFLQKLQREEFQDKNIIGVERNE